MPPHFSSSRLGRGSCVLLSQEGITQMSTAAGSTSDAAQLAVWNFPVDVTFRATGAHGWPQGLVKKLCLLYLAVVNNRFLGTCIPPPPVLVGMVAHDEEATAT